MKNLWSYGGLLIMIYIIRAMNIITSDGMIVWLVWVLIVFNAYNKE